jgi:hypothetical protein
MPLNLPTENFERSYIRNLMNDSKFGEAKSYISSYFFRVNTVFYFWKPYEDKFIQLTQDEIRKNYLVKSMKKQFYNSDGKQIFKCSDWFFEEQDTEYCLRLNPSKPRIYEEKFTSQNGAEKTINCINLFAGFSHPIKDYNTEYTAEIKEKVNFILDHLKIVLCNKNRELFKYVVAWLSNIATGGKNETILYFRSGQGTGKSIFTEFLGLDVFKRLVAFSNNPDIVGQSSFNGRLEGKMLLVLEEIPVINRNMWFSLNNAMKHLITGKKIEIRNKNKKTKEMDNILSLIFTSNNNALKVSSDDRRIICMSISHSKVGDKKYFSKLNNKMRGQNVGEAFFNYLIEFSKNNNLTEILFGDKPMTDMKRELINDNLPNVLKFVKSEYVLQKKDLIISRKDLFEEFKMNSDFEDRHINSQYKFNQIFREANIKEKRVNINKTQTIMFKYKHKELLKIFKDKNWITELDEFVENTDNREPSMEALVLKLKEENKKLKKEIREFKNT